MGMAGNASSVSRVIKRKVGTKSKTINRGQLKDSSQKKLSKLKHLEGQLAQREAELQIINSIQQGLAAELDFQAIINLVGDKLREILDTGDLSINWHNEKNNLMHYLYTYEHGNRLEVPPIPPTPNGQFETMRKTHQPIVANSPADFEKLNIPIVPGTDT